jgi:PhoH-like ATPase
VTQMEHVVQPQEHTAKPQSVRKHFVLDTNVLLHNPNAIHMFEDNEIVIPLSVIEELDRFKKNNDDTGRNARQVIREIDRLRKLGRLTDGVPINDEGGILRVDRCDQDMPFILDLDIVDNRIIAIAHALQARGERVIFVSKDINARVKADAVGVPAEDFEAQKVDTDWLYLGYREIIVPDDMIDTMYNERQLHIEQLEPYLILENDNGEPTNIVLEPNECLMLRSVEDESHSGLARRLADTNHVIPRHQAAQADLRRDGPQRAADHGVRTAAGR